jgi:hypothetical protein
MAEFLCVSEFLKVNFEGRPVLAHQIITFLKAAIPPTFAIIFLTGYLGDSTISKKG